MPTTWKCAGINTLTYQYGDHLMYDPTLRRFISADSVVPGAPDGSLDGVALKPLTVDFHETGFVTGLNAEHGQGFWFQLSAQERQEVAPPWGPANPQTLNRYAYVQNNPVRYTDPTGHTVYLTQQEAALFAETLHGIADALTQKKENWHIETQTLIAAAISQLTGPAGKFLAAIAGSLNTFGWKEIAKWRELAHRIDQMNGPEGVAIGGGGNAGHGFSLWVLSRTSGDMKEVKLGWLLYVRMVPSEWNIGAAFGDHPKDGTWWFEADTDGRYLHPENPGCPGGAITC